MAQALRFAKRLQAAGVDLWVDRDRIAAGTPWDSAVQEGLQRSSTVVVLLTPASVESPNVLDEISYAIENNKQVVPILWFFRVSRG